MTKEFSICLEENKPYYRPGDTIKGYVQLNLNSRPADIQLITINFKGIIEVPGEHIVLIDKSEKLALPVHGQKYTTFSCNKPYQFEFKFEIPKNSKSLPSTTNIPKAVSVLYYLTAIPKKPSFNFSHSLPVISKEVKLFDLINIDSIDYRRSINMNKDLGFTNGSKPTQWNLTSSKSAFIRGEKIQLECEFNNFPVMKKSKALEVYFIRCVYKNKRTIEKKILMHKTIDLHITKVASTQSVSIIFNIPSDIPISIFPESGRVMSVSYIIQADLNMKGAKSAIKLKDRYSLEAAIVIGTYSASTETPTPLRSASYRTSSSLTNRSSTINLNSSTNNPKSMSTISLPLRQRGPVQSFHAALGDAEVKPLAKLDVNSNNDYRQNSSRRSYLNRSGTPSTINSESYFDQRTSSPSQSPPMSPIVMRHRPLSPHPIPRSITPLPPMTPDNHSNTTSYTNRSYSRGGPIVLEQTLQCLDTSRITISSPHEIGPDDVINRGPPRDSKTIANDVNDNEKIIYENLDAEKSERCNSPPTRVPSLTRQSTVSTASSSGLVGLIDEQIQACNHISPSPPLK